MAYQKKRTTGVINRVYKYKIAPNREHIAALEESLTTQCYLYNRYIGETQKAYDARQDNLKAYEAALDSRNIAPALIADLRRALGSITASLAKVLDAAVPVRGSAANFEKRREQNKKRLEKSVADIERFLRQANYTTDLLDANQGRPDEFPSDIAAEIDKIRIAQWKREHPLPTEFDLKKALITQPRADGHPYLVKANYGVCAATLHRAALAQAAQLRRFEAGENMGDLHFKRPPRPGNQGQAGVWNSLQFDSYGNGCKLTTGSREIICEECRGEGAFDVVSVPCPACQGKGAKKCPKCRGAGTVVHIPVQLRGLLGGDAGQRVEPDGSPKTTLRPGRYACPLCKEGRDDTKRILLPGRRTVSYARIKLHGIGEIKVDWYRSLPDETAIRNMSVLRQADGWWVCLFVEIPFTPPAKRRGPAVGLDFGLREFTASDGRRWAVPGHMDLAEASIAAKNRKLAGQKKGSWYRRQTRRQLAKAHLNVRRERLEWQRMTAKEIVTDYPVIQYEHLAVKKLTRRPAAIPAGDTFPGDAGAYEPNGAAAKSRVNKAFADVAIAAFVPILDSAAERFGATAIAVAPDAQTCCECGRTPTPTDGPQFVCDRCGNTISRRLNSAKNAAKAGQLVPG